MRARRLSVCSAKFLIAALLLVAQGWSQQQMSSFDRGRVQDMLQVVAKEVHKHYYDPKFHGLDWDAKVAEAKQKIEKTTSMSMALSQIAGALGPGNRPCRRTSWREGQSG